MADPESVDEAVAEILSMHGRIDNLVTSAGFTENFDAISYPHDRMQRLWAVVVNGTYLFATRVGRHLIKRQAPGNMVFIGSMSGSIVNIPQPQAPYNAAKAAVSHLAASLAVEWAGQRIRVNCISPGYILTSLYVRTLSHWMKEYGTEIRLIAGLAKSWTKTLTFVRNGPLSSPLAVWVLQKTSWDRLHLFLVTHLDISLVLTYEWMVVIP